MSQPTLNNTEAELRSLARESDDGSAPEVNLQTSEEWRPGEIAELAAESAAPPAPPAAAAPAVAAQPPIAPATPPAASPAEPPIAPAAPTFEQQWQQQIAGESSRLPELQDANSPLSLAVRGILQELPLLSSAADGVRHAVTVAQARAQAAAIPELQARVDLLTRENQRLASLTSITGSPPARQHEPSTDLGERELRRLARDHDTGNLE